ncbi:MAG: hypothetical protein IPM79_31270 [Polyangiaceae bacterium]|nr:hypothetical protein [Polyangiaceae bacterium]
MNVGWLRAAVVVELALIVPLGLLSACGDSTTTAAGGAGGDGGAGGAASLDFVAGADRPVTVKVPPGYDPASPAPLVILLHGYGATGFLQDVYLELGRAAMERGVVFAAPDGTRDSLGRAFWNATDACCDFEDSGPDDSAYLASLVDEISAAVAIDPARVFFAGHSNGGFMSHRFACDHAEVVAAIASVAGAMHVDPTDCAPSEPVSVLQVHGTLDDTVLYEGGESVPASGELEPGGPYPSALETAGTWVEQDGCDATPTEGEPVDLDVSLDGAETTVSAWGSCDENVAVELWTIEGGTHIPIFYDDVGGVILDWLLAHPK